MWWRWKFGELLRHGQRMCRTYGAPDFSCDFSQAFRPGLAFAAPTALAPRWAAATRRRMMIQPTLDGNYEADASAKRLTKPREILRSAQDDDAIAVDGPHYFAGVDWATFSRKYS
jgi:hypothetical protein